MFKLPKIPEKEELLFQEKSFLLSLYEQYQSSAHRKILIWILAGVLAAAWPLKVVIDSNLSKHLIGRPQPSLVIEEPYRPVPLEIRRVKLLLLAPGKFSVYAQVTNPNPDISVSALPYEFVLKDAEGKIAVTVSGKSFLLPGESKFLLLPLVNLTGPVAEIAAELRFGKIRWTRRAPELEVNLEVLQKRSGVAAEGNFFVEGLVKNLQGFGLKKVEVEALAFDVANQEILGVNSTVLTDLRPFESRYFRMLWPRDLLGVGEVQVTPAVNLLEPGAVLEAGEKIPPR